MELVTEPVQPKASTRRLRATSKLHLLPVKEEETEAPAEETEQTEEAAE